MTAVTKMSFKMKFKI